MNSFRSCVGSAGFTTSTPGGPPKRAMWVKSRSGSNGKLFESAGAMQCVATPETTSVYPSGAAFATNSEPITPPAPARFSTMKFSLKVSLSLCDTRRPRVSAVPPGAKGTTMRTVLAGQLCARASGPPSSRATSTAALGPKCRAGCEIDASIGVILPEHRAKIAVRPPRGLCATYRNGKSHGNHRRTTDPLAAGRGLARAERSRGLEGVHRGLRSDRKSFRYRVPRRHGGVGGARESQVPTLPGGWPVHCAWCFSCTSRSSPRTDLTSSVHRHPGARVTGSVFLIDPAALDVARPVGAHEESQVRVGGDPGAHRGTEDFDPAVAALEAVNDVARRLASKRIVAKPGFHRVLDDDAHLDEVAASRFARNLDSRRHRVQPPSKQADSLTTMSTES